MHISADIRTFSFPRNVLNAQERVQLLFRCYFYKIVFETFLELRTELRASVASVQHTMPWTVADFIESIRFRVVSVY